MNNYIYIYIYKYIIHVIYTGRGSATPPSSATPKGTSVGTTCLTSGGTTLCVLVFFFFMIAPGEFQEPGSWHLSALFRGNRLSNTTCITHVFLKLGESFVANYGDPLREENTHRTNEATLGKQRSTSSATQALISLFRRGVEYDIMMVMLIITIVVIIILLMINNNNIYIYIYIYTHN